MLILAAFGMLIFQQLSSAAAAAAALFFDYSRIDPDNAFMEVSVHHALQVIPAFAALLILARLFKFDFHIRFKPSKKGFKSVGLFLAAVTAYIVLAYIIGYKLNMVAPYGYPLNSRNITGTLSFQLFLSGPSEEILFRALPIAVFARILNEEDKTVSWASVIITAFLFSLAHISWSLTPPSMSFDTIQLLYCFAVGTAYGVVFMKTKSVVYPMIMHSMSNIISFGIGYLIILFFK